MSQLPARMYLIPHCESTSQLCYRHDNLDSPLHDVLKLEPSCESDTCMGQAEELELLSVVQHMV